ncbi:MAG: acetyl-CoA carboxylase biotin carboxyl carrier protein [Pseudomonadales bacterium]
MSVDLRKVKKLIELVEESGITELEVRDGEETIRIARSPGTPAPAVTTSPAPVPALGPAPDRRPHSAGEGFEVRSPMAGTFYRAPEPEAEPFVEVGASVAAGDVLCIIESMKMMNEIKAERAGVVTHILVENGEAIGSGRVLFRFE